MSASLCMLHVGVYPQIVGFPRNQKAVPNYRKPSCEFKDCQVPGLTVLETFAVLPCGFLVSMSESSA